MKERIKAFKLAQWVKLYNLLGFTCMNSMIYLAYKTRNFFERKLTIMVGMIIADDELLIRQGLLTIPWNEYGIEVLGVAANGEEVQKMIISREINPRILLTDIKMPGLDGLDLIESVKREIPDIKSILLTGYQDFRYAQTAIKLGAYGYILKPSDPSEIIDTVLKAKKQIEQEDKNREESSQLQQRIDIAKSAMRDSFLLDLLYGRIEDPVKISNLSLEYNVSFDNYVIMLIELDSVSFDKNNNYINRIEKEIRSSVGSSNKFHVLIVSHSVFCLIIDINTSGNVKEVMSPIAESIRIALISHFDINVSVGISGSSTEITDINILFNQSMNCLKMKYSLGKGAIIHLEDLYSEVFSTSQNKVIRDVLAYIEKHYMEDITLHTVSEYVHLNHIYLSRLIKKELSATFLEILTQLRMKRACELLVSGSYRTYEISGMVGIKDSGYFSQVFKKYTGLTPIEYREDYYSKKITNGK